YMLLTRRTLEALLWYKRFAQAELDVEQGQEVAS
ncbi:MAG: type III-B CRISPR module-associated protein Cmr5, partial [Chloroflexia bacterium]|nr:type III-B CRISPR module-associated protein Cmr5 [Chloroflexia bacterium]